MQARHTASDATPPGPPLPAAESLLGAARESLEARKALDIVTIPLAGKSTIADYMVVASGGSARQVAALAGHVGEALSKAGAARIRTEGLPQADWVLIDAGDIIVHIFRPEVRGFYNLEKLWTADIDGDAATRH